MNEVFKNEKFTIRYAEKNEISIILGFIKELAEYEKMLDMVDADEETLYHWIFDEKKANALFGVVDGKPVGMALYFYNFSTFKGRAGIYLEDLFVKPQARKIGLGKAFLKCLAQIALKEKLGRVEWVCLNWNTPSIEFYKSLGAKPVEDWIIFRMEDEAISKLAGE